MKKIILVFVLLSSVFSQIFSQDLNDVFWYNDEELNGSARYTATAGAIGSSGSDLSAVSDNPAGSVYFVTNRFSWSPSIYHLNNTTDYFGQTSQTQDLSIYHRLFRTAQIGLVLPYISSASDWNKIAFGFNMRLLRSYDNHFSMAGINGDGLDITQYFLAHAQGIPTGDLNIGTLESFDGVYEWLGENYGSSAQKAFLAYQGYLIDPVSNDQNNTDYVSNASHAGGVRHRLDMEIFGKKHVTDFFVAGEYKKKLALGLSFQKQGLNLTRNRTLQEDGYDAHSVLQSVKYQTQLKTDADGYGFKIGLMYKLIPSIRLSLAYHSPVWWTVKETLHEILYSESLDRDDLDGDGNTDEINYFDLNPEQTNVYQPYRYISPGKTMAGMTFIFQKSGLISFHYTYTDWGQTHLSLDDGSEGDYFKALNRLIRDNYTAVHTLSVGGELKVDDFSLRAGYSYRTSPYRYVKDLTTENISFGVGYDFGSVEVDFAAVTIKRKMTEQLFPVGLTSVYDIRKTGSLYTLTMRYNF